MPAKLFEGAIALFVAVSPAAVAAQAVTSVRGHADQAYQEWHGERWQVLAGDDYCAADLFLGPMTFAVEKYWWDGRMQMQVTSGTWLSLVPRHGRRTRLSFRTDNGGLWSAADALVIGVRNQLGGFVMELGRSTADSVADRLANGRIIEIDADGRTLGRHSLEGSAEAMAQLETCVETMRVADRRDPFAN